MEEEEWRDVVGYEGKYQISNKGNSRSLVDSWGNPKPKPLLLKLHPETKGYLQVRFSKDGKQKTFKVHRLVALAFIPNPLGLPEVNHKDEDKTNNCVGNLEWCDHLYNIRYGTGIRRNANIHTNNPKRSKIVLQLDKEGNLIREWPSISEIKRQLGYNQGHVSECCRGERAHHKGYVWKYRVASSGA